MAILDRRVQVLFDPAIYAALEVEAAAERVSVAALIRESVNDRLNRRKVGKQEALERLFARADSHPDAGPIDWESEKRSFERETTSDLP
ncbi:hypothetical protein [Homoserinimonas sp. OAct 916]|uniref:hypothetical protein n=1 Tax=Homoserinimonas sp. OAct 916 TaxID=2211450 RepID=UPI0013006BC5|nr:hypothetical protein [Homoserinimonas sp. OAct 916]